MKTFCQKILRMFFLSKLIEVYMEPFDEIAEQQVFHAWGASWHVGIRVMEKSGRQNSEISFWPISHDVSCYYVIELRWKILIVKVAWWLNKLSRVFDEQDLDSSLFDLIYKITLSTLDDSNLTCRICKKKWRNQQKIRGTKFWRKLEEKTFETFWFFELQFKELSSKNILASLSILKNLNHPSKLEIQSKITYFGP